MGAEVAGELRVARREQAIEAVIDQFIAPQRVIQATSPGETSPGALVADPVGADEQNSAKTPPATAEHYKHYIRDTPRPLGSRSSSATR
jgi:hypothetical protein